MTSYFHWQYISFMRFSQTLATCPSKPTASCDLQQ